MANILKQRNSGLSGAVPDSATVEPGELILNFADGRLYYKDPTGSMSWVSGKAELNKVTSWATRAGDIAPAANDYSATQIAFIPQPELLATNVQDAIDYLVELKSGIDHVHTWSSITGQPSLFPSSWALVANKPSFSKLAYLQLPGLASFSLLGDGTWGKPTVSVNWSEIQDKPRVFPTAPVAAQPVIWSKILDLPNQFPTTWGQVSNRPYFGSTSAIDLSLDPNTVLAGDGSWTTISNLISLQQTSWGMITDKPTLFPSSWGSVQGKPNFGTISQVNLNGSATNVLFGDGTWGPMLLSGSVSWTNVLNKPLAFPSDWADVSSKPLFGSTSLIDLSGDATTVLKGDGTWGAPPSSSSSVSWSSITGKPNFGTCSAIDLSGEPNKFLGGNGLFGPVSWSQVANKPVFGTLSALSINGNASQFLNGNGQFTDIAINWNNISGTPAFGTVSLVSLNGDASTALRGDGTWASVATASVQWAFLQSKPSWISGNGDSSTYLRGDLTFGKVAWSDISGVTLAWSALSGKPSFGTVSALSIPGSVATPVLSQANYFLNGNGQWIQLSPLTASSVIDGGFY